MRKKVLITGGTSDLGYAIINEFQKRDYDIIFTYKDNLNRAQEISKIDGVEYVHLDVCDEEEISRVIEKIDYLDCLVNCAAFNDDVDLLEHTKEGFIKTLTTNLVGPFLVSKHAYALLIKTNGIIINIASMNGIDSMYPESVDYDASKAGLINLTKNLAKAFAPQIRVNAVAPGWIETKKTADMNPEFRKAETEKILLKRFAKPEEVAKTVGFLACDDSYINGSVVCVDGGRL